LSTKSIVSLYPKESTVAIAQVLLDQIQDLLIDPCKTLLIACPKIQIKYSYHQMRSLSWILLLFFTMGSLSVSHGQIHPKEAFGRKIFDSFRNNQFSEFYHRSIFSLEESEFREFLYGINNLNLRNDLHSSYTQDFPLNAKTPAERWKVVFAHTWRQQWNHIARYTPKIVQKDAFDPILRSAHEFGIQWETVRLIGIEVLLPVSWEYGRFEVKRDPLPDQNSSNPRTLHLDRRLTYRLELAPNTHGNAFMIGYSPEDSEQLYNSGIVGNGSGQGDLLVRLSAQYPEKLYYFCPDEPGAGGPIEVHDFDSSEKPNQRTDILLTFTFGQPEKAYQIIIRDVMSTPRGEVFCERPEWRGEVHLPRGLSSSK
jgi:hypothetical protein